MQFAYKTINFIKQYYRELCKLTLYIYMNVISLPSASLNLEVVEIIVPSVEKTVIYIQYSTMKYLLTSTTFMYPWEKVSQAFWNRYPNPYATHGLSEDTFSRIVDQGRLISKRLLTKNSSKVPKWGERFIPGNRQVCIIEESIVDPHTKTLTTYTRNIGLSRVLLIEEKCVYKPHPENSRHTTCEREAFITSAIYGFSRPLQSFGLDRFKRNISKTMQGFEHVLGNMYQREVPAGSETSMSEAISPVHKLSVNTDKLKHTANKAKELAKSKAASVVVTN